MSFKCWLRGHLWTWTAVNNVGETYFAVHACRRCPAQKQILIHHKVEDARNY